MIKAIFLTLFCWLTFIIMGNTQSKSLNKPKVLIVTTGGTIASRVGDKILEGQELISAIPPLKEYAEIEVVEIFRIGSSKMKPENWLYLAKYVDSVFVARKDLKGIIITHGTDSMEETAFFLDLVIEDGRPIVFVGSMRSANELSADGPANLVNGVRVAVEEASKNRGVLVVMNERIAAARDVQKIDNRNTQSFESPLFGYLGVVDPDTIRYYRQLNRPELPLLPIKIQELNQLPSVDLVADFTGFDDAIMDYFLQRSSKGLVLATFAGGRTSSGALNGLRKLKGKGKLVVVASRVPFGRIIGKNYSENQVIVANHFSPVKSRILLMVSLAYTDDPQQIQQIFDTY